MANTGPHNVASPRRDCQPRGPTNLYEGHARGERATIEFTRLLTNAIQPDSWQDNGGLGYPQILNGVLVVRQYEGVHSEIRTLLDDLRALAAPRPQ